MFESFAIPTGFDAVTDVTVLSNSGNRSANYFFEGDKIVVSEQVFATLRPSLEKGADGKLVQKPVYYVLCNITSKGDVEGRDRLLPMAAFRRLPKDAESFLTSAGSVMRTLAGASSDAERFSFIKGKTFQVLRLVDGEQLDYAKTNFATRDYQYKPGKFAVFELA